MNYVLAAKLFFLILLLPGIAGAVLPVIPGLLYMLFVAIMYAAISSFKILTLGKLGILGGLAVLSVLVDFFSGAIGARFGGASAKALLWGMFGFLIGLFLFPPFGPFIGLFAGVFLSEYNSHKNGQLAIRSATFSLVGKTVGIAFNLVLAFLFFGLSLYFIFF